PRPCDSSHSVLSARGLRWLIRDRSGWNHAGRTVAPGTQFYLPREIRVGTADGNRSGALINAGFRQLFSPGVMTVALAGLLVGRLPIGFEPVRGEPDRLYRPLKQELSRAMTVGRLPFWADRFGLGIPLVAESHVAAFYPLNWLLYPSGNVTFAY